MNSFLRRGAGPLLLTLVVFACSSESSSSKDSGTVCKETCQAAGYADSKVDTQPNEVNCFCSTGTGTISADACKNMCSQLGKTKSAPFGGNGSKVLNSCQCS